MNGEQQLTELSGRDAVRQNGQVTLLPGLTNRAQGHWLLLLKPHSHMPHLEN